MSTLLSPVATPSSSTPSYFSRISDAAKDILISTDTAYRTPLSRLN